MTTLKQINDQRRRVNTLIARLRSRNLRVATGLGHWPEAGDWYYLIEGIHSALGPDRYRRLLEAMRGEEGAAVTGMWNGRLSIHTVAERGLGELRSEARKAAALRTGQEAERLMQVLVDLVFEPEQPTRERRLRDLADSWDARAVELRGDREENLTWQDEAADDLAAELQDAANAVRTILNETQEG